MPTYVYKFIDTDETIEVQQAFTDDALTEAAHPETGTKMPVKKVFLPVGVTFKGGGFYKTDSRGGKGTKTASNGDSGSDKSSDKTSGDKTSGDKSSSDKSSSDKSASDTATTSASSTDGAGSAPKAAPAPAGTAAKTD
ncbi:MAG: FmdB family transcriptional regulator [Actinobacteria bacterium]|nr:FmdB family transcriptional regulator [Actinomycetota bacterium]